MEHRTPSARRGMLGGGASALRRDAATASDDGSGRAKTRDPRRDRASERVSGDTERGTARPRLRPRVGKPRVYGTARVLRLRVGEACGFGCAWGGVAGEGSRNYPINLPLIKLISAN